VELVGLASPSTSGSIRAAYTRANDVDEEVAMTQYGTLRTWSVFLTMLGALYVVLAAAGTLVWAIEVDGFWPTLGVLLVGGPVAVFLATLPIALAQALRAIADVGDTVAAR
jgi:hypothetical protein